MALINRDTKKELSSTYDFLPYFKPETESETQENDDSSTIFLKQRLENK